MQDRVDLFSGGKIMLRKLIVRLFLGCVAFMGLLMTTAAVASYLAFQQPAFYTHVRAQSLSPTERDVMTKQFQLSQIAYNAWLDSSLARQQAQQAAAAKLQPAVLTTSTDPYDPKTDTFTVRLTEQQLNGQLATSRPGSRATLQNPLIHIGDDCLELGFEVKQKNIAAVFSVLLEPSTTENGNIRLDIRAAHIGQLRIPLKTILRCLPRDIVQSAGDLDIDLTLPAPHLTLKLPKNGKRTATIKSIHCQAGELVVELLPPILERPPGNRPQPATLSNLH